MRIGIVGERVDAEAHLVGQRLEARGVTPAFLDLSGFPHSMTLEVRLDGGAPVVLRDGEDLGDCAAWYVRRFGYADPLLRGEATKEQWPELHGQMREWSAAENQKAMTVASLLLFLQELAPVVNPPEAFIGHNRKPHQVHLLQKAGLPVPPFVVSNDVEGLRAFLAKHPRVVYKPVAGGRLTREIDEPHLVQRVEALKYEPILLQALAEGRHVRAYVAGDRVVGAGEILFDKEVRMDYRATSKGAEPFALPKHVEADCVRAARACGMPFTGLDVIVDEDRGVHHFLECNPSPMFANFERMTGIPVSHALADLLVERAKSR